MARKITDPERVKRTIRYETRDGDGNDIVVDVAIKKYPAEDLQEYTCPICCKKNTLGVRVKNAVSADFTDWAFVPEFICPDCADYFSLFPYNYISDPDGIRLLNVRQIKGEIISQQKVPFRFVITTTQKKHLFYKSVLNGGTTKFSVNLDTMPIMTSCERMKVLFGLVENILVLGGSKNAMKIGVIPHALALKAPWLWGALAKELESSREIQIPLYCGQKLNITEEEALCNLDSIRTALNTARPL